MNNGSLKRPTIVVADTPALLLAARGIITEYSQSLNIDLCFQDLAAELDGLPGDYAAPAGTLILALDEGGVVAGCGAIRPLPAVDEPDACEMKRLFVRPAFRGAGWGRVLAEALMEFAREAGYRAVLLDTLDEMEAAREMYRSLGFEEVPPYYFNPIAGAHYLRARLQWAHD